jgi:hypothetical protein
LLYYLKMVHENAGRSIWGNVGSEQPGHRPSSTTVQVTITPEISTPTIMAEKAYLNLMPNKTARMLPVHAPVMGRGMLTNSISPSHL